MWYIRIEVGTSACLSGKPSSMAVSRSCMASSDVVSSLRRCQVMGSLDWNTEHKVLTKSSSTVSSDWSTDMPAIRVAGMRSGGADTTSGSDIPGGLCVPVGYLERASDV